MPTAPIRFRHLFLNYLSLAGAIVAGLGLVTDLFLILVDILVPSHNPYVGIVTYMLLPGFIVAGLGLVAVGAAIRYVQVRRGREFLVLPHLDLNTSRHRFLLGGSFGVLVLFLGLSAVGGYQAYHFTESVEFCGQTCHTVMRPEYTAYQRFAPRPRVVRGVPHRAGRRLVRAVEALRRLPGVLGVLQQVPAPDPDARSRTCGRRRRPASSATGRRSSGASNWQRGCISATDESNTHWEIRYPDQDRGRSGDLEASAASTGT